MTPLAQQARRVNRSRGMMPLRSQADVAQHWRRRLSSVYGPAAWVEFKAMYRGEIDARRRELARAIRAYRHAGYVR